jgi:hypothetical protein
MRVYDGAQWIAASAATQASLILYEYTATSGQTTFSGADDNAATLSYTADNLQVVMNGFVLDPSDFTATNGTSVVLASGAAANDLVNIYAFKTFTVADTVSASAGGTFSGNVTVNALLNVDNIRIDGNTISSTDTNGDITLDPDGTGKVYVPSQLDVEAATGDATLRVHAAEADSSSEPILVLESSNDFAESIVEFKDSSGVGGRVAYNHGDNALRFQTNGLSEGMRIDSSGNLLLGTTTNLDTASRLNVKYSYTNSGAAWESNSTATHNAIVFKNPNGVVGTIQTSGSSTAYNTSSDYRLKENVADMTGAIDRVKALAPKRFNFIADADTTVDGFLAHEAQAVVPEAITGTHNEVDDDGNPVYQGIDQSKLVPLLTGALQEAIAKIEALETQRADLEARLTALENAS